VVVSEQPKHLARRFIAAFAAGDTAAIEAIVAADVVDHNTPPGQRAGRAGLLDAVALFHRGFPDLAITVEREVAEGDLVALYGTITGTNTGPLLGHPATGRRAAFAYVDLYRVAGGRIVETWHVEDLAGMLRQLGGA
jgi:steroid delta-isomerase-like uncharacterized protein